MLSDEELKIVKDMAQATGLNYRQLFIAALSDDVFLPTEYTEQLVLLNKLIARMNEHASKIGVNINQLAKTANTTGDVPAQEQLQTANEQIKLLKEEAETIWRYTRRCLQEAREPTVHCETV
jgi:hypothetical protein